MKPWNRQCPETAGSLTAVKTSLLQDGSMKTGQ